MGGTDMIISKDNPEWLPYPVREEPCERFTLMWMSLSSCYILWENEWEFGICVCCYLVCTAPPFLSPVQRTTCLTYLRLWLSGQEVQQGGPPLATHTPFQQSETSVMDLCDGLYLEVMSK